MTTVLFINSKAESSSKIGHDYKKQRALKLCFLIEKKLSESFEWFANQILALFDKLGATELTKNGGFLWVC